MKLNLKGVKAVIMLGSREAALITHWVVEPLDEDGSSHQFNGKVRRINKGRMEDEENLKLELHVGNKIFTFQALTVMLADDKDVDIILNASPIISIGGTNG